MDRGWVSGETQAMDEQSSHEQLTEAADALANLYQKAENRRTGDGRRRDEEPRASRGLPTPGHPGRDGSLQTSLGTARERHPRQRGSAWKNPVHGVKPHGRPAPAGVSPSAP